MSQYNDLIYRIRGALDDAYRSQLDKKFDLEGDSLGQLLEASKAGGASKLAKTIMERLPEPENEEILDYWAVSRVVEMDTEFTGIQTESELRRLESAKRSKAMEIVKERIQDVQFDDIPDSESGQTVLRDPVSGYKARCVPKMKQYMKEDLARRVIQRNSE